MWLYSVYYISVGSSTCFGCWHPSSGARTTVITASGSGQPGLLPSALVVELDNYWTIHDARTHEYKIQISNIMKIRLVVAELFHAYGYTDGHTWQGLLLFFAVLWRRLKILRSAHTVYLCILCGCENKQRLFPYTALTDRFL